MSTWRKYFKAPEKNENGVFSPLGSRQHKHGGEEATAFGSYPSNLPEIYAGHPNRIERYNTYEQMDTDSEINAALDILAEFSTQVDDTTGLSFNLQFIDAPTETESKILRNQLQAWSNLNKFDKRIFRIFRNILKYGDQVFLRDPETFELFWVNSMDVLKIIVNESAGKKAEQYVVRNINPNFETMNITQVPNDTLYNTSPTTGGTGQGGSGSYQNAGGSYNSPTAGTNTTSGRFQHGLNEYTLDAEHVVHLSLTEGLDSNWPFGNSILELIFRVYKQKELLEDAVIIYRIQRAPERRVFYIDVGNMPSHMAMSFVERVKNELHQRRIPTSRNGHQHMDATYSPISINEDFYFPQTAEGRGSKVEVLPGGQSTGEITDLSYFNNKMMRGLRIPSSYLPTGEEESPAAYNDGRVGTALIQEFRFNQYCQRLQNLIVSVLDTEFKAFLKWRGINIDSSIFNLRFNEPQNFAHYRQSELDGVKIATFSQMEGYQYFSKRFLMKRYLGMTEEEMAENSELWLEEHQSADEANADSADLRNLGITPGGIESDLNSLGPEDMGDLGNEDGESPEGNISGEPSAEPTAGANTGSGQTSIPGPGGSV